MDRFTSGACLQPCPCHRRCHLRFLTSPERQIDGLGVTVVLFKQPCKRTCRCRRGRWSRLASRACTAARRRRRTGATCWWPGWSGRSATRCPAAASPAALSCGTGALHIHIQPVGFSRVEPATRSHAPASPAAPSCGTGAHDDVPFDCDLVKFVPDRSHLVATFCACTQASGIGTTLPFTVLRRNQPQFTNGSAARLCSS